MTDELKSMNLTWNEVQRTAKDRKKWKRCVAALCPTMGDEEE